MLDSRAQRERQPSMGSALQVVREGQPSMGSALQVVRERQPSMGSALQGRREMPPGVARRCLRAGVDHAWMTLL
ncbi:hypothetical protein [Stenotrophomonas sp.]|uniref:hypothetical protein n=1 Tax=Stenotrophomonas sp. TaxID=69392 RepID=UPI0028B1C4D8|nr:hypothetical protein [Stenotrophomonas sp.]